MAWDQLVSDAVHTRRDANTPIWNLAAAIKRDETISPKDRKRHLRKLYSSLSDKDIRQSIVDDASKYEIGVSFRSSINELIRVKRRMRHRGMEFIPGRNPKLKDRAFAESLGIPVPKTYVQNLPYSDIKLSPNTILKPTIGSSAAAVFYVDDQRRLHSIRSSEMYHSLADARHEIDKNARYISLDSWIVEEAIIGPSGQPANDFKIYAFYGVLGLHMEIDRNSKPGLRYATYDDTGEQIEIGPKFRSFDGEGIPQDVRDMAIRLSLALPAPFARLDFHRGRDGTVLGEITPHPGGVYAGSLHDEVDKKLGDYFADAQGRLYIDLLQRKEFPEFKATYYDETH